MSRRLRWIRFDRAVAIDDLRRHFEADAYTKDRNWGFRLDEASSQMIRGCHVTRHEITDETISPLGVRLSSKRVEFTLIDFEIRQDWKAIEIASPPRSVAPLLNQIGAYTDFESVLEPMEVDLRALLKLVGSWADTLTPTKVKTSSISLNNEVAAVVEVSGKQALLATLDGFVPTENASLTSVVATVRHQKREFTLHATRTGSCKLTGQWDANDLSKVRRNAFAAS